MRYSSEDWWIGDTFTSGMGDYKIVWCMDNYQIKQKLQEETTRQPNFKDCQHIYAMPLCPY